MHVRAQDAGKAEPAAVRLQRVNLGRGAFWLVPDFDLKLLEEVRRGLQWGADKSSGRGREPDSIRLHHLLKTSDGAMRVHVKLYSARKNHSVLRRFKRNRPRNEGFGLAAFANAGLPTPQLLAFGDTRICGLFQHGLVVTAFAPMEGVVARYRREKRLEPILAAAALLSRIHSRGLSHGDACLRNFAVAGGRLLTLDLPSWGAASDPNRLKDLKRFAGTVLKLTGDTGAVRQALDAYTEGFPQLPVPRDVLLAQAERYATAANRP